MKNPLSFLTNRRRQGAPIAKVIPPQAPEPTISAVEQIERAIVAADFRRMAARNEELIRSRVKTMNDANLLQFWSYDLALIHAVRHIDAMAAAIREHVPPALADRIEQQIIGGRA